MTGSEFLAAIDRLGFNRETFAAHFGLDRSTVYRWTAGARAVPPWVPATLALLLREQELEDALIDAQER
jgi:hypothetical protein